ncbi:TIR domain-containing protein [Akkermansiaceae bacterium]|nr:TIR domain-containing protein [Akkermansiaceae bacterium]MDB4740905.1 TIR domain-containing protein [Akkermansiaceae bacterium]
MTEPSTKEDQTAAPSADEAGSPGKIFISYSRRDKEAIMPYVELFRANGMDVWMDESGINASSEWAEQIVHAITECDVFILFLSDTSVASENVRKEIGVAASLNKKLLPLKIEEVEIPPSLLYHLNSIHFLETQRVSSEQLLEHVFKAAGSSRSSSEVVSPAPAPQKKKSLIPMSIASLLLVGLIGGFSIFGKNDAGNENQPSPANGAEPAVVTEPVRPEGNAATANQAESSFRDMGTRVAVLYFENNTTDRKDLEPLAKGLAHMVSCEATGYEGYDIVERNELAKVLQELELSNSKNFDPGSAARIGKLLGAEQLVLGSFMVLFNKFRIDAKMVDVATGRILHSASAKGDPENFDVLAEELAAKLLSKEQASTTPNKDREALPVDVALSIGKALQMIDDGNQSGGIELLNKLQEQHPESELLKNAIRMAE